jgi:hypothetical protein
MKSRDNDTNKDEDRCSACPSQEGEEVDGEPLLKPLTGWDLYVMHKYYVDKEAELG